MSDWRDQECSGTLWNGRTFHWRVGALVDWAEGRGIVPVPLRPRDLMDQFDQASCEEPVGSGPFVEHARATDTDCPIIVCYVKAAFGDTDGFIVADGLHRLWKAFFIERRPTVPALRLPLDELPDKLL
jgi:hypothetical protein